MDRQEKRGVSEALAAMLVMSKDYEGQTMARWYLGVCSEPELTLWAIFCWNFWKFKFLDDARKKYCVGQIIHHFCTQTTTIWFNLHHGWPSFVYIHPSNTKLTKISPCVVWCHVPKSPLQPDNLSVLTRDQPGSQSHGWHASISLAKLHDFWLHYLQFFLWYNT